MTFMEWFRKTYPSDHELEDAWLAAKADSRKVLEEIRAYLADPWRGYSKAMAIIERELKKEAP